MPPSGVRTRLTLPASARAGRINATHRTAHCINGPAAFLGTESCIAGMRPMNRAVRSDFLHFSIHDILANLRQELGWTEGFGKENRRAGRFRFFPAVFVGVGREHDDRDA